MELRLSAFLGAPPLVIVRNISPHHSFAHGPFKDHFGVVKAFLDQGILPRVITGTSAGGLIAALVCTRTDDELKRLLVPDLAHKITACEEPFRVWAKRAWTTGARFDRIMWARKVCLVQ